MTGPARGILLDIEGTTSSISFVYDEMFPFVRRELEAFVEASWNDMSVKTIFDQIARDAGHASRAEWTAGVSTTAAQRCVVAEVVRLMAELAG